MAVSLNRVTIIGNVGKDPESRSFQNGGKVVNFSVAVNESWKDKSTGEWREKTEWVKVAVFNEHVAKAAEQLHKGSKVYVEGKLQTRKWQDQNGRDNYTTEVVIQGFEGKLIALDPKRSSGGDDEYGGGYREHGGDQGDYRNPTGGGGKGTWSSDDSLDDDVPF